MHLALLTNEGPIAGTRTEQGPSSCSLSSCTTVVFRCPSGNGPARKMSGRTIHASGNSPWTYCASAMCPPSFAYLVLSRVISPGSAGFLKTQWLLIRQPDDLFQCYRSGSRHIWDYIYIYIYIYYRLGYSEY